MDRIIEEEKRKFRKTNYVKPNSVEIKTYYS